MARWICLGHDRHLTPLFVRQFSIGLTFVLMGALAAPAQAQTDDSNPCGKVPDASRYRVAPSVLPGYREALDRWQACLSKRAQEIIQKAKEAREVVNDIRENGGVETVSKALTSQIDNVMEVSSSAPSQVAKRGSQAISQVYDTPAGGNGVAKVVGRTATTAALNATTRAAANFDAALADAGGGSDVSGTTKNYVTGFASLGSVPTTGGRQAVNAFETAMTISAKVSPSSTATAREQQQYQQMRSTLEADAAIRRVNYAEAKRRADRAAADARIALIEARASLAARRSVRSGSSTSASQGWAHSSELGGMDPK